MPRSALDCERPAESRKRLLGKGDASDQRPCKQDRRKGIRIGKEAPRVEAQIDGKRAGQQQQCSGGQAARHVHRISVSVLF